jgi:hypothetical protein
MIEDKYINYGECQVCHKKAGRLEGTELCYDCFEKYLDQVSKGGKE